MTGFAGLLIAWLVVALRTVHVSLRGDLLRPPPPSDPIVAVKG